MDKKIKLTIQEIVHDFECLLRFEERILTLEDIDQLEDYDSAEFLSDVEAMIQKYLPTYRQHLEEEGWSDDDTDKQKAMLLSDILQRNFTEIFYQLV